MNEFTGQVAIGWTNGWVVDRWMDRNYFRYVSLKSYIFVKKTGRQRPPCLTIKQLIEEQDHLKAKHGTADLSFPCFSLTNDSPSL